MSLLCLLSSVSDSRNDALQLADLFAIQRGRRIVSVRFLLLLGSDLTLLTNCGPVELETQFASCRIGCRLEEEEKRSREVWYRLNSRLDKTGGANGRKARGET